ncbi:RNA polymerase sigma factor [Pedobacter sp. SL55]|uniref:RNA polymerase sigma factor n=1 Tax=Pedobacter sp. SL55 TaxID=2995161 RepID=UPI0022710FBA|nr:sigma factor-like helix-turn-helix DNA-binding protein [Pedobacter sp. SL55]WAC40385.1 hypothetical protein OVA16_17720 [Pedobacter sp. SL55]
MLITALNSLSFRQREVMYLRYYQDMSFDEISQIMEIPKKTAYNIVFIALDVLKKKLNLSSAKLLSLLATLLLNHTN